MPLTHPLFCTHSHHLMWLPQTVFLCHFLVHYNFSFKTSLLQLAEDTLEHLCLLSPAPRNLPMLQQTLSDSHLGREEGFPGRSPGGQQHN